MPNSAIRQNFSERCEALVNKQINMELHASYVYMAMVIYLPSYYRNTWLILRGIWLRYAPLRSAARLQPKLPFPGHPTLKPYPPLPPT